MELPILHTLLLSLLITITSTQSSSFNPIFSSAATQTLSDSGFLSMSLTLRLTAHSLPSTPSATIFIPSNAAFHRSGPLPLSLLLYHILPTRLPLPYLSTLPPNTLLPTLLPNSSLTITSSPLISLNDVAVSPTPLYDDGTLLMLAIPDFFNSSSLKLHPRNDNLIGAVLNVLNSRGCSIFATFLEAQLATEIEEGTKFTIFAPLDEAVAEGVKDIGDYTAILKKHIVPRLITWRDLIRLPDDTLLPTFSDGFEIRLKAHPLVRLLNGMPVTVADMYCSHAVVVHGIQGLIT